MSEVYREKPAQQNQQGNSEGEKKNPRITECMEMAALEENQGRTKQEKL